MILPAITDSPPKRFTPRRCALESRPFRLEPTPFLCAISVSLLLPDLADADFREALPVTLLAPIVLAALPLENDDLPGLAVPQDFTGHGHAIDQRRTHRDPPVATGDQDVPK